MAKDGFLTAKAVANRIKAKGLQKLRWYCQICEKQCRDENGFKCHCASESHQRKILLVAESPEKYVNDYSAEFQRDFMKLLSSRYGTRRVNANQVYQEFIADRTHLHMNATKWATLSEFTMHLGKEGLATVDETPKGWFITWVDNSPKTLARQEAILKKERMEMDDEQREQRLIQQQIEKANALKAETSEGSDEGSGAATELVRENEEEKIKLDISIKPVGLGSGLLSGGSKLGGGTGLLKPKSLNALAAKKPNPFSTKAAAPAPAPTSVFASTAGALPLNGATKKRSAVEEIIEQEMAKKKRLEAMNSRSTFAPPTSSSSSRNGSSRFDERGSNGASGRDRERERTRDYERVDKEYRSSRDGREEREYRSSRDSRDDKEYRSSRDSRDDKEYRSSRDSHNDKEYRSSRDDRDSREERDGRESKSGRSDRDNDRDRDSYRDHDRERERDWDRDRR